MVIPREPEDVKYNKTSDGLRRDYTQAPRISEAYLLGALHDSTKSAIRNTYRISSKCKEYCVLISEGIKINFDYSAWVYREGNNRKVWIVEFSQSLLKNAQVKTIQDKIDYISGYFDTDGGIAKSKSVRFYVYFAQKDYKDLSELKKFLTEINIKCGKLHNPSKNADPKYWRFFISSESYSDFVKIINSRHPNKKKYLRMKI